MSEGKHPADATATTATIRAISAAEAPARKTPSNYPSPFAERMSGREKRVLGDLFGLKNFGVNLTRLEPGAVSSLRHSHSKQDEFIYVLEGTPTLVTDHGPELLAPGMCAGFAAGNGNAHCLENRSAGAVVYLEVGDRTIGDQGSYPDDDIQALKLADGGWAFAHKDGSPY
ncbi:cupin domain-containing protein [Lacisediminimonas profundi]|uniref:cupin domain-containing protein n=1 Tax=Lacisediminimonas profundi TaxID=2603856 RepID=UPI00124B3E10|nr:cupin domain-containing protein [Lacisediminimonas profundi]